MADMLGCEKAMGEAPMSPPYLSRSFFLHSGRSPFDHLSWCSSYLCTLSLVFVPVPRRFATATSSVNTELTFDPRRIC